MSRAMHGTFHAAGPNPYAAIELGPYDLPAGEQEAFREAFDREIAGPLGLQRGSDEYLRAYTVARWAWRASWMHGVRVRGQAVRAAMGEGTDGR